MLFDKFRRGTYLLLILFSTAWIVSGCTGSQAPAALAPEIQTVVVTATSVPAAATSMPVGQANKVTRSNREDEYIVVGPSIGEYQLDDLIVIRYIEPGGTRQTAAVGKVIAVNPDNIEIRILFQTTDFRQEFSLAALEIDRGITPVNLETLIPVNQSVVGFTLVDHPNIRIRTDSNVRVGDRLEAKTMRRGGSLQSMSPQQFFVIERIESGDTIAQIRVEDTSQEWPAQGTLLVTAIPGGKYEIHISDYTFTAVNNICVRSGDRVEIQASGTMVVGRFVGDSGPEGKTSFMGIQIDDKFDIIREFPHAVLMYRIEQEGEILKTDEGWLGYHKNKVFIAERDGCLAFDINDIDNSDNSGEYFGRVVVTPP